MCKPLIPEMPKRDYLDDMIEAHRVETSRWYEKIDFLNDIHEIRRDSDLIKKKLGSVSFEDAHQEFGTMMMRAGMEAAYKAAQRYLDRRATIAKAKDYLTNINSSEMPSHSHGYSDPNAAACVIEQRQHNEDVAVNFNGDRAEESRKIIEQYGNQVGGLHNLISAEDWSSIFGTPSALGASVCGGDGVALMSVSHPKPCGLFGEEEKESERDRIARVTREMCGG